MDKSFFFRLPFNVADATLPVIPTSDIEDFLEYDVESDPLEHWIFDSAEPSLKGLKGGRMLTTTGGVPTYNDNSMTISLNYGSGLQSDFADRLEMTTVLVCKRIAAPGSGQTILTGTLEAPGGSGKGSAIFMSSGVSNGIATNIRGTPAGVNRSPFPVAVGEWVFVGLAERSADGIVDQIPYIGGASNSMATKAGGKLVATVPMALGNSYNSAAAMGFSLEVFEYLLWDRFLTVAELDGVYTRAKERLAKRGLTLA